MKFDVSLGSPSPKSFRAAKIRGMFDVPPDAQQSHWEGELPLEDLDWRVGAIVGASGSGKSTIARALWPKDLRRRGGWNGACVLDDFPEGLTPKEIVDALIAVGLSSPPAWLRPYSVLSTGQQFRAELARALVGTDFVVFDEFTSVVDRTVAKAASVAVAKYARRARKRFVAVTCHKDVLPWLEPDWVFDTDRMAFGRERLRRPHFRLVIREGSREAWPLFRGHHYLSAELSKSARCFLAYVTLDGEERLAGFFGILPLVATGRKRYGWWRGSRAVVLPDLQGLGIGNRMIELVAEQLWRREHKRYSMVIAAPGLVDHCRRHPEMWRMVRGPTMSAPRTDPRHYSQSSAGRLTTAWEYVPEELRDAA